MAGNGGNGSGTMGKVLLGLAAGVAIGLMVAPMPGKELREKLGQKMKECCPCSGWGSNEQQDPCCGDTDKA